MNIETESIEFKSSLSQLDKGIESLTAMLNKHGAGEVLFGVDNLGNYIGLRNEIGVETIKKIETRIQELVKPTIIPTISIESYNGISIIKVTAKGNRKPYSCYGDYRIRVGSENKKIDPDLLGEIFFDSSLNSLENIECLNQELSFNKLKYYFSQNNLTINDTNFYSNEGLLINGKFNMLAELLADENNTSIKVVRFSGLDKTHMLSRTEFGYKCLIAAMIDASEYIKSLNETRVDIESTLVRKETRLFDNHAFEEAWTNACVHNKWIRNVPPAIYIFDDRIEIVSTGGLPYNFSEEEFYSGISRPINAGLFKVLGQLGLIEQTGHGNLVVIDKYGKNAFDIKENHITVTIPFAFTPSMKQIDVAGLTTNQTKVLNALKENPLANRDQLSTILGISSTRFSQIVNELKELGRVERIGKKGGYWKVN